MFAASVNDVHGQSRLMSVSFYYDCRKLRYCTSTVRVLYCTVFFKALSITVQSTVQYHTVHAITVLVIGAQNTVQYCTVE